METGKTETNFEKVVYLSLIMATTMLAVLIITLDIILAWEVWMIPVIFVGTGLCWGMYVGNHVSQRVQLYFCGIFGMFLVFYYCVKIKTIYDCGTIIVIMIFLFSLTGERLLTWFGIISANLGLINHLLVAKQNSTLNFAFDSIVRTVMVFLIVPLSSILVNHIMKAWIVTEKAYQEKIAKLEDENERANNFLANVSHEVRTPISAVLGLSYVLKKENHDEQTMSKIKAISEAGHRVSEQISDILDFTEIDMQKIVAGNEIYMMNSMVYDLLVKLSHADSYGLEFVVDIDPQTPTALVGDESKIKRILWHLVRNGFKFTKEGGVYLRIYPIKREYGINLVMEVHDTGIGMEEDEVENIYEKFYQVDSGRSRIKGGLGLGIPIANGLTRSMGGVLTIESKLGEGTVAKVSIPQAVEDGRPFASVNDKKNCVVAGFLGFVTIGHPKIREYYMEMISHMTAGLSIPFYRVQSKTELERLTESKEITHLIVGGGEYLSNRRFIDDLAQRMNVALVSDAGFKGQVDPDITVLKKPFYGSQITSFLNHAFSEEKEVQEIVTFPGVRALVVDDEHMNIMVAREILKRYDMEITAASSGQEAISLCETNKYDIVFMDHMMPGMDGVEAMKRIKQNASRQNQEIMVVALTANAISSAREMFISEGFDGFVSKPIDIQELERVLKRVLPGTSVVHTERPERGTEKKSEKETDAVSEAELLMASAEREWNPEEMKSSDEQGSPESTDTASGDFPLESLKAAGLDTDYGLDYCGGDFEFYRELLLDYAGDRENKLSEINGYFENNDWHNYEVRVHGVKSTSKLIGGMDISEEAKLLEMAAKSEDESYIKGNHDSFIKGYSKLMETIAEVLSE